MKAIGKFLLYPMTWLGAIVAIQVLMIVCVAVLVFSAIIANVEIPILLALTVIGVAAALGFICAFPLAWTLKKWDTDNILQKKP